MALLYVLRPRARAQPAILFPAIAPGGFFGPLLICMNANALPSEPDSDPPPGICVCSLCRLKTYEDDYKVQHRGRPQPSKTIKRHKLTDRLLAKKKEIQAAVLEDSILLATAGVAPTTEHGSVSSTDEVKHLAIYSVSMMG